MTLSPLSVNGSVPAPSTYEMLRLAVQERLRRDGVDDLEVARTGMRNDETVLQAIRDTVDAYQREADRGVGAPLSRPAETVARLARSLLQAGPLTKYFNDPTLADEVSINGDVITATGRDGRQTVDREPTCEAELTSIVARLLAANGATVDLANTVVVHQIWNNQVRASVSIPPTAEQLDCTFRIYRQARTSFDDLVEWNSLSTRRPTS